MKKQKIYGKYVNLYDLFTHEKNYKKEARFLIRMIKKFKKSRGNSLLDVGCGTGSHDLYLKKHFKITSFDKNRALVKIAKKKNPKIDYRVADMKKFNFKRKFDIIISVYGVLHYNYTYKDLERTLRNFSRHIEREGVLIFDFAIVKGGKGKFEQNKINYEKYSDKRLDAVFIGNNFDSNPKDTIMETNIIFLIRKNRGPLNVVVDKHLQGYFELSKIKKMLSDLGFTFYLYDRDYSGRRYSKKGPVFVCIKK